MRLCRPRKPAMQTLPRGIAGWQAFSAARPGSGRLIHFYWRFSRAMTVGVRGMVLDGEGRVFLIKHSYVDGWHMPGGGVEAGETLLEALTRELAEEGNIELTAPPVLHAHVFPSGLFTPRPRRALRDPAVSPERAAGAGPRDRRARLLPGRCAARRHHQGHARPHCRSAQRDARCRWSGSHIRPLSPADPRRYAGWNNIKGKRRCTNCWLRLPVWRSPAQQAQTRKPSRSWCRSRPVGRSTHWRGSLRRTWRRG